MPAPPQSSDLHVLAETERWAAIDKPAGLLSFPGVGLAKADSIQQRARLRWPGATGPITVHRLDMDTSGVILVALDEAAQRNLSVQFQERRTRKSYVALLQGRVDQDAGVIDLPLRPDLDRRPYQLVDFDLGKSSRTRYEVLERTGVTSRVRFEPITGRSHQIRMHAAARKHIVHNGAPRPGGLGCPVVGDPLYGPSQQTQPVERLMLHAERLEFNDPDTNQRITIEAPVPF
ncbi:MAG: RluA family pseudouridine synthase [Planctomycetota bacterium]